MEKSDVTLIQTLIPHVCESRVFFGRSSFAPSLRFSAPNGHEKAEEGEEDVCPLYIM